jgi:hypothetical protein
MKKRTLIAILGIWIAIIPSLGIPSIWKNWVIILSGLCVTVVALKKKYIVVDEIVESDTSKLTNKKLEDSENTTA